MKKLLTLVSAITAGAIGTAAAEVSVSGSGTFYYASGSGTNTDADNSDSMTVSGGSIDFSMSTETTNGITVTASGSITADTDDVGDAATAAAPAAPTSVTFAMDGMTVSVGDIDNAGSGTGEGGDVSTFAAKHAGRFVTASAASLDSAVNGVGDGQGVVVTTSIGDVALGVSFVPTVGADRTSLVASQSTTGLASGYGINLGFDVAGASVDLAAGGAQANTTANKNNSATAIEISYPATDSVSVTVGGSAGTIATADVDNMFAKAAYTMDADTTLSLGYAKGDNTTTGGVIDKASTTSVNVSRSLGGGVSLFAEYASISANNAGVSTTATSFALGTSVAF